MNDVTMNIAMILFGLICFILGLRYGYRWHKSGIFPKQEIDDPNFRVIYIDPRIVRKMYGIAEPDERR